MFAALLLASFQPLASTMRNHKELRYLANPLNTLYAAGYAAFGGKRMTGPMAPVGTDARVASHGGKPRLLVLVLGETGRSGNFGINGYARDTTPELVQAKAASFRNAWSCGTSTAASVPCMFSPLGREGFLARDRESENLLDVLQHAGLAVLWIDNQAGGCKGVCDRVPNVNTSALKDPQLCAPGRMPRRDPAEGPRCARGRTARREARPRRGARDAPDGKPRARPTTSARRPPSSASSRSAPAATCPIAAAESLVNAYDNTIVYTDHVLGATIRWLQQHGEDDSALLYVADHGESLGENNLYLHGLPYAHRARRAKARALDHVAVARLRAAPAASRCNACARAADERITHDHLFHSVLGTDAGRDFRVQAHTRRVRARCGGA